MKIYCRTNLDLCPAEKWPEELPEVPRVGDLIESGYVWLYYHTTTTCQSLRLAYQRGEISANYQEGPHKGRLELAVVRVTWVHQLEGLPFDSSLHRWIPQVELHLPPNRYANLRDFYEWYGMITGRGVHAFI